MLRRHQPVADPTATGSVLATDPDRASTERRGGRGHRTWRQRLLLGVGALVSFATIGAAAVAGWAWWQVRSIDRTDVDLDAVAAGDPENFLVVGSDTRSGGDPNDPAATDDRQPLADTIMIVRVDPGETRAQVLSLPRDLWVTVAGTGDEGRINAAYATGGPQRLIDTIRAELDVPVHHYVEVDFAGFQRVVEAIDGVPMWFDRAMRDRNSGLEVLHPGCTTLDGYGALAFARARHLEYYEDGGFVYDGTGDLGRIARQQHFIRKVIDRARSKGMSNPLTLKELVEVGTDSVTIDDQLAVGDLVALGRRFAEFDSADLGTYSLPITPRTTTGGAKVVDLDVAAAEPVLDLFRDRAGEADGEADPGGVSDADAAPGAGIGRTDVVVTVLNSSGVDGLAVSVADEMVAIGFDVDHFGNGDEDDHPWEPRTIVRHGPGAEVEALTVAAAVDGGAEVAEDPSMTGGEVVLYLGGDFVGLGDGGTAGPAAASTSSAETSAGSVSGTGPTVGPPPQAADPVGMVPVDTPTDRSCG